MVTLVALAVGTCLEAEALKAGAWAGAPKKAEDVGWAFIMMFEPVPIETDWADLSPPRDIDVWDLAEADGMVALAKFAGFFCMFGPVIGATLAPVREAWAVKS